MLSFGHLIQLSVLVRYYPNGPVVLPLAEPVVAGGEGSVTDLLCRSHRLLAMASLDSRKGDSSLLSRQVMQ